MTWTGKTKHPTYLFHYTDVASAEAIAAEGYFEVGPGSNFGFGLYATDLDPDEGSPEEIRAVCFEGDAPTAVLDGVLVLLGNHPSHPFVEVDRRVFQLPARLGQVIPLQRILVATGRRLEDHWTSIPWE